MSNNTEYTKEYIDNVENYFNEVDRLIVTPAICKTLSYQQVTEFYAKHSMADTFKEYLLDNAVSAEEYCDEVQKLEEGIRDKEKEIDDVKDDLEDAIGDIEDLDVESITEMQIIDIVNSLQSIAKRLDKLGR